MQIVIFSSGMLGCVVPVQPKQVSWSPSSPLEQETPGNCGISFLLQSSLEAFFSSKCASPGPGVITSSISTFLKVRHLRDLGESKETVDSFQTVTPLFTSLGRPTHIQVRCAKSSSPFHTYASLEFTLLPCYGI